MAKKLNATYSGSEFAYVRGVPTDRAIYVVSGDEILKKGDQIIIDSRNEILILSPKNTCNECKGKGRITLNLGESNESNEQCFRCSDFEDIIMGELNEDY